MKEIIKKMLNKLVDLIAIPFEYLYKFVKNVDNIVHTIVRAILLIILLFVITYILIAKPYKKVFSGFQFEKYSNEKEAKTAILKQFPLDKTSIKEYDEYLTKIGAKCFKIKNGKRCTYKENLIFKKYNWVVNIRETKNGKSLNVNIKKPKNVKKSNNKEVKKVKETKNNRSKNNVSTKTKNNAEKNVKIAE